MKHRSWVRLVLAAAAASSLLAGAGGALAAPSGWLNVDGLVRFNAAGGGTVDWANSGPPGAACANGGVNVTGTGGLFNCGLPGAAGAPPIAPTLTPGAAADPSIISAVFIADPISGDSTACGDDPTTLAGGGPKNGDAFSSYSWDNGTNPAKTELSNVFAVSHTRADNGHPEVYFGAEKLTTNGDTHMDFEFLQSVVTITGSCIPPATGGNFTGNRTQGDLLASVDFANGGAVPAFSVHQWHCAADPGPQPPDGTICNPAGGPEHYELIAAPFATVTVNAALMDCGGWVCRDQDAAPSTIVVTANNFMEGGVDLFGVPFAGCFNTFLPHTRTSGAFTATLTDFAGPIGFKSCRDPATTSTSTPTGSGVAPGSSVRDTVGVGSGGAGFVPTGTVTFFLCSPSQVTGAGCPTGTQVGAPKALVGGAATSDPSTATSAAGKYCWRTAYAPDATSAGVYAPASHTNATTECFNVAAPVSLPNTGADAQPLSPWLPLQALFLGPGLLLALAWRRSRSVAILLIAGVIAGSSPAPPSSSTTAPDNGVAQTGAQVEQGATPLQLGTVKARAMGWRLVIPRIGVDAQIQSVGRDAHGAMASPSSLETVGWFNRGPSPGQPGDAVIDGHYGDSMQAGVFRKLRWLRPGDAIQVVWPDGRIVEFEVASSEVVPANAHPPGVFAPTGPARLSLITCEGAWDASRATYSDRLIVTAVPV